MKHDKNCQCLLLDKPNIMAYCTCSQPQDEPKCIHGNNAQGCFACYGNALQDGVAMSEFPEKHDKNGHKVDVDGSLLFDDKCERCDAPEKEGWDIELRNCLEYCTQVNGREDCKNCGLNYEMIESVRKYIAQAKEEEANKFKKILNSGKHMYELGKHDEQVRVLSIINDMPEHISVTWSPQIDDFMKELIRTINEK